MARPWHQACHLTRPNSLRQRHFRQPSSEPRSCARNSSKTWQIRRGPAQRLQAAHHQQAQQPAQHLQAAYHQQAQQSAPRPEAASPPAAQAAVQTAVLVPQPFISLGPPGVTPALDDQAHLPGWMLCHTEQRGARHSPPASQWQHPGLTAMSRPLLRAAPTGPTHSA